VWRFAVQTGIDIAAAGEQDARGALDDVSRVVALVIELDRFSAGAFHGFEIVGQRAARSDCDSGHLQLSAFSSWLAAFSALAEADS
jgi:hypothetical protein